MRSRAPAVLLLLLLPGCTLIEGCSLGPYSADWEDASLWEQFPPPGGYGNFTVRRELPPAGLDHDRGRIESPPAGSNLTRVGWRGPDWACVVRCHGISLYADHNVTALVSEPPNQTAARDFAEEFLMELGVPAGAQRSDWAQRFSDSGRPSNTVVDFERDHTRERTLWSFDVRINAPYDLTDLLERRDGERAVRTSQGMLVTGGAGWSFEFATPAALVEGTFEGRSVELRAGPFGHVRFSLMGDDVWPTEREQAALNDTMAQLALGPAPDIDLRPRAVC